MQQFEFGKNYLSERTDTRAFLGYEPIYRILVSRKDIKKVVLRIANQLNEKFTCSNEKIVMVCLLKGAIHFFSDLTRNLTFSHTVAFIQASLHDSKHNQLEKLDLKSKITPEDFDGKIAILVDELFVQGDSISKVKFLLEERTLVSKILTCVMFFKNCGDFKVSPDFQGLCLPNVWLVGYGIDDAQSKRGWNHLFAVSKPPEGSILPSEDDTIFHSDTAYVFAIDKIKNQIYG